MKKRILKLAMTVASALTLGACSWLAEPTPAMITLDDYFAGAGGAGCIYTVNACYVPLCWEFNNSYFPEWFIGDVVSDDALKGGEAVRAAMTYVYLLENFKTIADNEMLLDMYRANYQGIGRCNMALSRIVDVEPDTIMDERTKARLLGECYYLRAYYYFRLVRIFGGVPITTTVLDDPANNKLERATADQVYDQIIDDLTLAEESLWTRSDAGYTKADLGRATKGAAQAMLQKVYLYKKDFTKSKEWGDKVIESGEYDLIANYKENFYLQGENNIESVFEIQYSNEASSDYGSTNAHLGATRGTFTTILTRGREYGGWGWNHPTQNLYDEFEENDARLQATIFDPVKFQVLDEYLGIKYYNAKTGMYNEDGSDVAVKLGHDSRGELNKKEIRFSDVLLMRAEAAAELGDLTTAKTDLERVRLRARCYALALDTANVLDSLSLVPEFPNYSFKENGIASQEVTPTDDQTGLIKAIRHERRVELGMESHRWFDLCRWGTAKEVMNTYRENESEAVRAEMNPMQDHHYLFPIPPKEIELNPMAQNPGY